MKLIDSAENYYDEARLYEVKAAVYARLGDFKKAQKNQENAIQWAKKFDWNLDEMELRLTVYNERKPWIEK